MIAQIHKIKNVIWIGTHIDILEYMQMSQDTFSFLSKGEQRLNFPTYHSFLGSLGLLLTQKENDEIVEEESSELSSLVSSEEEKQASPEKLEEADLKHTLSGHKIQLEPLQLFGRQYSLSKSPEA